MPESRNGQSTREAKVLRHYNLARAIACKVHQRLPKTVDLDDLISAGVTGLIEAIDRFDASRSVPFEVYARHRIQGAILDTLRAQDWVPRSVRRKNEQLTLKREALASNLGRGPTRIEMAQAFEISVRKLDKMTRDSLIKPLYSLDAPLGEDNPTPLIEQVANDDDLMERWQRTEITGLAIDAVQFLPERERMAINLYYLHELSLKQVGQTLGVTESRACQLVNQGVKRLQYRLRRHAN